MTTIDSADLILINGNVITMDVKLPRANSIVIKKGEIIHVGTNEEGLKFKGEHTEVMDLEGKTTLPGFIESHIHPTIYGVYLLELDCRSQSVSSIDEILELISDSTKKVPVGEWIRGWGWDDSKLKEKRYPTRWDLDKVAPNHPVVLTRTCEHMAVLNSKALELSGISKDTKNPPGGYIERDAETGELTGLLKEAARDWIAVPKYGFQDIVHGMELAQEDFAKWGITTVHDMSTQTKDMQVYQHLQGADKLKVRVRPWIWAINQNGWEGLLDQILSMGIRSGFGNDFIKIQGVKFMLDGSVGGRTAAVAEPYVDDAELGILYCGVEDIYPSFEKAIASGLRVAVHGIGERAIEVAVQAFEKVNENMDITHMRNRIEHCALPTDDQLKRVKNLELIAASSIGFLHHIGDSYMNNLGPERMKRVYPHKSFKEHGIVAPGNSDLPVTGGNPWTGIYTAVTRKTITGQVLDTTQNITIDDALKAYTTDAAYSSFEEQTLGVIKPSAKADIIVVSDDPFKIETEKIKDIQVERTFVDGKQVYSSRNVQSDSELKESVEV
ncbi:amidohydrolase [Sporosarcina sp. ACRSM]|uniref:amidohydrolase n=1 Tax=Sporosarcina sp. ACRSM TaxID=2918216 RepID=UPI001EF4D74D|nr:amidohydrolase [Sporosarcina sp. ACRSM]MCG7334997.1 amidohydrolase [Sporosarcina sp. ACRSM]